MNKAEGTMLVTHARAVPQHHATGQGRSSSEKRVVDSTCRRVQVSRGCYSIGNITEKYRVADIDKVTLESNNCDSYSEC